MYRPRSRITTPLWFKLYMGFLFLFALTLFGTVGYAIFTVVSTVTSDPAVLGRIAGEIVSGYNATVK